MSTVRVGDVLLNYQIEGPDGAPWITLSHGLATNFGMWAYLAGLLSQKYRVLRYDARGHGQSSVPDGNYTLDLLVGDAKRLLDALGIEKTHFVGLSMGGMVALGLALKHPERLRSISVCDARAQATQEYKDGWTHRIGVARDGGMDALVERTLERWFTPAFRNSKPKALDEMRMMIRATPAAGYIGCASALQNLDFGARLGELRMPVLYLVGADDLGAPPAVVKGMHAATPGSRFVEIPEAGHIANIEQPERFAQAITSFIDGLEKPAG